MGATAATPRCRGLAGAATGRCRGFAGASTRRCRQAAGGALLAAVLASTLLLAPAGAQAQSLATPPTPGALYRDGQTGRYLLGGTWLYRADPGGVGLAQGWWRGGGADAGWAPVSVPNAFNAGDLSYNSDIGWVGWYRRDFTLPARAFAAYVPRAAQRWIVRFESVNYRAAVWLNGHFLGFHAGAYLPFEFDLSALRHGVNHLVVRVDSRRGLEDLPAGPGSGWWNFGGLLGEVYLRSVQEADIQRVAVHTLLACPAGCPATIVEQATVRNPTSTAQTVTLGGRYGPLSLDFGSARIAPGATWAPVAAVTLPHPRLWAPGQPYLYRATLTLSDAKGRRLGGYVTYSGVRTIAVRGDGRLTLNGRVLDLRGVDLHEQDIVEGAALDPAHLRRYVDWARALGADMLRAHYPLNPQIEELADEDGILLWSEIPAYATTNADLADPKWRAGAYAFLTNDIQTNQNHPSVAVWSIGNELPIPATFVQARYVAGAVALAHRLDPTRPVGMAVSAWPGLACQSAYAPLDVVGVNDYFGWYDAGGGSTDDRDALSSFLDGFRACYPSKAALVTEFGFEANRNGPVEEKGTYQFQANSAAYHLEVFATKPWLSGALYFALQDFAVTPGWAGGNPWPDPPFLHKGLIDLSGHPKPAFSVVAAIFHATRQIGPAPRPGAVHGPRRRL